MEEVSRALRRWRRSMTSYTSPSSRRNNKVSSSTSMTTTAAIESSSKSDGYSGKVGGKKLKSESLRQRINRHNNAVGMQVDIKLANKVSTKSYFLKKRDIKIDDRIAPLQKLNNFLPALGTFIPTELLTVLSRN